MPYDYYNWSNATNLAQGFFQAPNYHTGDMFWTVILYMIFAIALIGFSFIAFDVALLAASFFGIAIGIFLVYSHAVAWYWLTPFPAVIIFTILYIVWGKN